MGYNPKSRCRLPFGFGKYFPAFFTHHSTVDMLVIDMMRPLFDKGVRPESFADMLLELDSKKHMDMPLSREALLLLRHLRCSLHFLIRCTMLVLYPLENTGLMFTRCTT
jgi:hypothetical protein